MKTGIRVQIFGRKNSDINSVGNSDTRFSRGSGKVLGELLDNLWRTIGEQPENLRRFFEEPSERIISSIPSESVYKLSTESLLGPYRDSTGTLRGLYGDSTVTLLRLYGDSTMFSIFMSFRAFYVDSTKSLRRLKKLFFNFFSRSPRRPFDCSTPINSKNFLGNSGFLGIRVWIFGRKNSGKNSDYSGLQMLPGAWPSSLKKRRTPKNFQFKISLLKNLHVKFSVVVVLYR